MSRDARSRVVLGAGIPIAALLFLSALILAFSRILLAVPEEMAPWVALLFATNILVGCALAAMIPGTRGFTFLITVLVATIVIGGVVGIVVGPRPVHSLVSEGEHGAGAEGTAPESGEPIPIEEGAGGEEPAGEEGAGGPGPAEAPPVPIVAQGLAFDTAELSVPADTPSVIAFDNRDEGIPHNVAVYVSQGGEPLFQGEIVPGPSLIDYHVPQLEAGEYYFQCDVHPTMAGTLTVA
ncbi:MAG: cupredoxin domain-containing protein [Actinomycetota bacterium]